MAKKFKITAIMVSCLILSACSSYHHSFSHDNVYTDEEMNRIHAQQINASDHRAYAALAESASSVGQSLAHLAQTEQAAYPPKSVTTPPNPASYGMGMKASIDWNGPVQPVVQQLANAANYKLRVLGKAPAVPIVVSVSAKNASVGNILRNVGYQSKKRAKIVVYPSTHTVELRYADS
jgi:defect-in-organelle-trafficking protein DotD